MEHVIIVGAGVAGMGAALALSERYRVTLLESAPAPGGHVNTVRIDERIAVDTGFIVYNERNYPNLTGLFKFLSVETQASDMSFGVSVDSGRFEFAGTNLVTLFCQPRNLVSPRFHRMLRDIAKFNRQAHALVVAADAAHDRSVGERPARDTVAGASSRGTGATVLESLTVDEFLHRERLGGEFRERYLLPMAAAIWSCPVATMGAFPAISLARFFRNHGLLGISGRPQWRTVTGGSQRYVARLLPRIDGEVRTGVDVRAIVRAPTHIDVVDASGHVLRGDHVVLATHADTSLSMLHEPSAAERDVLSAFTYQSNTAILHRDPALMPVRRAAWSSWNYLARSDTPEGAHVSVTYWMNKLQALQTRENWFVSLNPGNPPAPDRVHAQFRYAHPVFDVAAMQAQRRLASIQGQARTWFCGAWCGYGFHEDGLRSAVDVAARLGVRPAWAAAQTAPSTPTPVHGAPVPAEAPA